MPELTFDNFITAFGLLVFLVMFYLFFVLMPANAERQAQINAQCEEMGGVVTLTQVGKNYHSGCLVKDAVIMVPSEN